MVRSVYRFGGGVADGDASMRALLGRKGAGLAEMSRLGLPVPPGFTLTTEVANQYLAQGELPSAVRDEIVAALAELRALLGRGFGDEQHPLLVSIRAGARVWIPGLMPTILNLGMNPRIVSAVAEAVADGGFARDSYRRFITMYADSVLGIHRDRFEYELDKLRASVLKRSGMAVASMTPDERRRQLPDGDLGPADLDRLLATYRSIVRKECGRPFPDDPHEQLFSAIETALASWNGSRAKTYRRIHEIPDDAGVACTIQAMVFGNLGGASASGVLSSRDPNSGEKVFVGGWRSRAQGDDVARSDSVNPLGSDAAPSGAVALESAMPAVYRDLVGVTDRLERHFRDVQEVQFTVERGHLYVLECRVGKRTARAGVRMAVEMAKEGIVTKEEAILRVEPSSIDQMLHPTLDPKAPKRLIARGLPAGPGAVNGVVVFSADEAVRQVQAGKRVVLVRVETSPDDMHGMKVASGVLTTRGGLTSHAAVVARGMGKCCVAGCSALTIDEKQQKIVVSTRGPGATGGQGDKVEISVGGAITLDGTTGCVYFGAVPTIDAPVTGHFGELMTWADEFRRLKIRANADIPRDARTARLFGAEGIGLCRTEHMFFERERIPAMVEMIMAADKPSREMALAKLLPFQQDDFVGLFREMNGLPVTIRLFNPPLHEFIPQDAVSVEAAAKHLGISPERVEQRVAELHEHNPMLGHRGCRLAITYPEIYEMQVRALLLAAIQVKGEGIVVAPEVMIPLVATRSELLRIKQLVRKTAEQVFADTNTTVAYRYGTMIELPRAALVADELAQEADFFSFGTNDLTQTAIGLSRDDAGRFLNAYVDQGLLSVDPFQSIDVGGVGLLIKMGVEKGRSVRPDIILGVCGEHGADPASIRFFHALDIEYVSCSPFRVPVARLAAAQAALALR